jgi:DNA-directed RNA polymerase alpha subunit
MLANSCESYTDTEYNGETSYMTQPVKILVLAAGQEIKLRAIARKGIGKDHAKWMPVATCALSRVPDIQINEALMSTLTDEQKQEFVDSCPQKVFTISPLTGAVRIASRCSQLSLWHRAAVLMSIRWQSITLTCVLIVCCAVSLAALAIAA